VFTARYGLPTRCTAERYPCLEGSDGFLISTAAPIAPAGAITLGRVGLAPTGNLCLIHCIQLLFTLLFINSSMWLLAACSDRPILPSTSSTG
jgi:hypothetical protein